MGFMSGIFGSNKGLNYQASSAPLMQGVNDQQIKDAYQQTQKGLAQQENFMNALAPQGQQGMGAQTALSNMYMQQAQGHGPNVAQAQLAQNTQNNIGQQAALMAGQRGTGSNAGLLARQAAQQGGAMQQQAAGQAATLQAQQQLAAQQALQGLSGTQIGQQSGAIQGYNQAAQSEQQNLLNALAQYNNASVSNNSSMNNANASVAGHAAQAQQGLLGGLMSGIGSIFAHGGMVKGYADGGDVAASAGPQSFAGKFMQGFRQEVPSNNNAGVPMAQGQMDMGGNNAVQNGSSNMFGGMLGALKSAPSAGSAGAAPLQQAGGENVMMPAYASGGMANLKEGGGVKGKPKVGGAVDTEKNDTVPAMLSPGEVVIPRSVMHSEDPVGNAAKFVQACLAKKGLK